MDGRTTPPVDSRRWTGPEPSPPALDRRAARAAFRRAGGPGAAAPQRAAAAISWLGLLVLPAVVLLGADRRSWLPVPPGVAEGLRGGFEAWLRPWAGLKGAEGIADLLGDPRLLAVILALLGGAAGIASAYRHRAALARGFAAAEAGSPGAVYATRRYGEAMPFVLLLAGMGPAGGPMLLPNALALWLVARLGAGSLTAMAERRAAGRGWRLATPSGWDAATMAVSFGALLLLLARVLRILG